MKSAGLIVICLVMMAEAGAQDPDSLMVSDPAEFLELQSEEGDSDRLVIWLEALMLDPMDINRASVSDLMMLPEMNIETAKAVVSYREERSFMDLNDLRNVEGISSGYLQKISPYVKVRPKITAGSLTKYWRADWMSRMQRALQVKEGFRRTKAGQEGGYLGDEWKAFQRLSLRNDHISINLTLEKDPGEQWRQGMPADHSSAHIAVHDIGRLRRVVIGDFSVRGGQGLVSAPVAAMGKGRQVTSGTIHNWDGIRPYSSAEETAYMRGAGISAGDRFRVEAFYSNRLMTASEFSDSTFRMPGGNGLHRTAKEIGNRERVHRITSGATLGLRSPRIEINLRGVSTRFSEPVEAGNQVYNRNDFRGTGHQVAGLDHKLLVGGSMIFGEMAMSDNRGWALLEGVRMEWDSGTDLVLLYRHYRPEFQSLYGNAFAEGSGSRNETGFYSGISQQIGRDWKIAAYMDQFRFPAPRFGMRSASQGYDVLTSAEYRYAGGSSAEILFRSKIKGEEYKAMDERGLEQVFRGRSFRQSFRFQLQHLVSRRLRLRSRVEWVRAGSAGEGRKYQGILIFQDVRWQLLKWLRADSRFTVFGSEDYRSRIYQFENDLLFVMRNTMLNGRGRRFYLLLKADLGDKADLWFKYGVTVYEDLQFIGSGLDEIRGNVRSSVGMQVRVSL